MTKRIKPIFPESPPPGAPQVLWVADAATVDDVAARVPGAVGFVDLDRGTAAVRPGTLTEAELAEAVEAVTSSRTGG